ncbi:MAG: TRAP transporter fused permease subunit [Planctomycetaceae bacterium]|nr:TRAP transporter fused permease subunit [Planctomycetaceae bacterium]
MPEQTATKVTPRFAIIIALSAIWLAFQFYLAIFTPLHPMLQSPLHLVFALLIVFLYKRAGGNDAKGLVPYLDVPFFAGIVFLFYYFVAESGRLTTRVSYVSEVTRLDYAAMIVCVVVLMEAVRRVLGQILFYFILFFIVYAWFGNYFPWIFNYGGTDLEKFTELMTMGPDGILGTPLYTSANSLFYFIVFGVFFSACGGGQLLIDIGMKFSSKSSGGPAIAAVISSGLMGMISGSAVANVSTTGVMTIPMMKKVGYSPEQAGAIEAVASTGGQIMPPIMGVGAFIMAEMLGVPYRTVAFAAIIPACAYYMSVLLLVTFMAHKNDLQRRSTVREEEVVVKVPGILPRLYLLLPAVVLVYYMIAGYSLMRSGMMGIYTAILVNIVSRFVLGGKWYIGPKELGKVALRGVRQSADIAIPTAACGIIIGIVIQSGLATKMSALIAGVGVENLVIALIITTAGCMLLGMALPTVAAYLVAVILFVPTLTLLGIEPLAANMFVFYFGIMAQITPPVCLASFTAAGIAGANAWKTGWTGASYALVAFLIPFIFIYDPGILLIGSTLQIIKASAVLFLGVYFLAAGIAGFLFVPLSKPMRALLLAAAFCLIIPEVYTDIAGFAFGIVLTAYCLVRRRKMAEPVLAVQKEG